MTHFGRVDETGARKGTDAALAQELVDAFVVNAGYNELDTARVYANGNSERVSAAEPSFKCS